MDFNLDSNSVESAMEGIAVLVTDFREGVCFSLIDFLIANNAVPYVLVRDFEGIYEVYDTFPSAVPIILDYHNNVEATTNHIKALPSLTCIFNFNGSSFENLYRQTFETFNKSMTTSLDHFDETKICQEIVEAVADGYSLICNFVSLTLAVPTPSSVEAFLLTNPTALTNTIAASTSALNTSRNLKFVFEKIFFRQPDGFDSGKAKGKPRDSLKRKKENEKLLSSSQRRDSNTSVGGLLKKFFGKLNPCATTISVLNVLPTRCSRIKSPGEIKRYIINQANYEIKTALKAIHESALRNWVQICEENSQFFPPDIEKRFAAFVEDVERQSQEGRKILMDKVDKEIERTKQWDHVLGANTLERLRMTKERDIELKVNLFYKRKVEETRKKINKEIQDRRDGAKAKFYVDILEEQLSALNRIKAKSAKNKEELMLSYTGEVKSR